MDLDEENSTDAFRQVTPITLFYSTIYFSSMAFDKKLKVQFNLVKGNVVIKKWWVIIKARDGQLSFIIHIRAITVQMFWRTVKLIEKTIFKVVEMGKSA